MSEIASASDVRGREVSFKLNGVKCSAWAENRMNLADFLRGPLQHTGTHVGCEHGVCGACTVTVNGRAVRSCLLFAVQTEGADVCTVEGLAAGPDWHPLQQAFARHNGLQCGFCTPGILMTLYAASQSTMGPPRNEEAVRNLLSGNICRCTGYESIVSAALEVFVGEGAA